MKFSIFLLALVAVLAIRAPAAVITWETSVQMYPGTTVQTFVNTSGTGLLAYSATATTNGSAIVNGVDFDYATGAELAAGVTQNGVTVTYADSLDNHSTAFGDGSFAYDNDIYNLIASSTWGATTVTLSGLTIGQEYMLQIFGNDSRNGRHWDFETGFSDGVNNLAYSLSAGTAGRLSLSNRNPISGEGEPSGDYIIGTFIANAVTQSFEINGSVDGFSSYNTGRAQINGLQLREIPEPATLSLLALGGLLIRKRK